MCVYKHAKRSPAHVKDPVVRVGGGGGGFTSDLLRAQPC